MPDAADIRARIDAARSALDARYAAEVDRAAWPGPMLAVASVLPTFAPETLQALAGQGGGDELYDVLARSTYVPGGSGQWTLGEEARREAWAALGGPGALLDVLRRTPASDGDVGRRMLDAYLQGTAPPVAEQTLAELTAALPVIQTLHAVLPAWTGAARDAAPIEVPDPAAVRHRIDELDLLRPFERLAGEHFRGRARELQQLSHYVDALAAQTIVESVTRSVREVLSLHEEPPLVVHGLGGIGKSTLIARFILDHARAEPARRFPFVYIDFDRPGMRPEQPMTLLLEAVRQLRIQFPAVRAEAEALLDEWRTLLPRPGEEAAERVVRAFIGDFVRLLGAMGLGARPLLFVLDTFEEVQYRGAPFVRQVGAFLNAVKEQWPRLRTVISGRAPVTAFPYPTRSLPLGELDADAARGFLEGHGLPPETARALARALGGNPLTLWLAVEVWRREGAGGVQSVDTRRYLFVKVSAHQVQGQLFRRILRHVHDERVRRLAHPGLVLRRLTPALIREVLAEPCGLDVASEADAEALFEQLRREVALVEPEPDGAVRHRPDLRRVMVRLLATDRPAQVEDIHRRAVAFYERGPAEPVARAEELYHRLALGHPPPTLDARWLDGVEARFTGATLEELAPREQVYLASRLGLPVDSALLAAADLQTWERATARAVAGRVETGDLHGALTALAERPDRSPNSPLHRLDVDVRVRLGRPAEAAAAADRALERANDGGEPALLFALLLERARLAAALEGAPAARPYLDEADRLAAAGGDDLLRLEASLLRLQLTEDEAARASAAAAWRRVSEDRLAERADLVVQAAALLGADVPGVLARAVGLAGLPEADGHARRALARALVGWDRLVSQGGEQAGRLALDAGIAFKGDVVDAWRQFAETESAAYLREVLARLLARDDLPAPVADAVAVLFRAAWARREAARMAAAPATEAAAAPAETPAAAPPQAPAAPRPAAPRTGGPALLSPARTEALRQALVETFEAEELARVLRYRMELSLHSVSVAPRYDERVADLLKIVGAEGRTAELLLAVLEARPDAAPLQAFAQAMGLTAARLPRADLARRLQADGRPRPVEPWLAALGEVEARVCRVEGTGVDGTGFLVGPDLLLTGYDVVAPVLREAVAPAVVGLCFDRKVLRDGDVAFVLGEGTRHRLADDWLVAASPSPGTDGTVHGREARRNEALGYALLRLQGLPGREPVGAAFGRDVETMARTRGWITPAHTVSVERGAALALVHAPADGALALAFGTEARVGRDGHSLHYRSAVAAAACGAPCFDLDLRLVGLHRRTDAQTGACEGTALIALWPVLEADQPPPEATFFA